MNDETPARPSTRRVDPGLTRRLSMGMGTLTLAGAAFFGAVAPDAPSDAETSASSSVDTGEI